MPYVIQHLALDGDHSWAVVSCSCNPADQHDQLVADIVSRVRSSYGEDLLTQAVRDLLSPELAAGAFSLDHLLKAVRIGHPDPSQEGNKPPQLANYRSESLEMVAKGALQKAFKVRYPAAAQSAKSNANQPILGFDGWGICDLPGATIALLLIQVKGTDQNKSPPNEAEKLAEECKQVPRDQAKLARALTSMVILLPDLAIKTEILRMLEGMGRGHLPAMCIAPVIVRGLTNSAITDLDPIISVKSEFSPAAGRGISISIGTNLTDFGRLVMIKAREAA